MIKRVIAVLAPLLASLSIWILPAGASTAPVTSGTPLLSAHYAMYEAHKDRTYVVRRNDTLSSIGKKTHIRWQSLFCANRKKLHNQTDLIYPGQKLVLKKANCKLPVLTVTQSSPISSKGGNNPAPPAPSPIPQGTVQQIAQSLLNAQGWGSQYGCLAAIINVESGWNVYATNPYSGAYGIPQALPGSKMAVAGADWQTSAYTQLKWMIDFYIGPVYGSPCNAWSHEQSVGSY